MSDMTPIFLIGAARSGTKYLRDVLAASAGVAAVPYDVNYVWRYGAEAAPDDVLDPDGLTEKRRAFIHRTLPALAHARPGDILLEKTVSNTLRVPFVERVYPGARYIHLVRDGRDVTESAMRQWQAPPDLRHIWRKLRALPPASLGYAGWFGRNFAIGLLSGRGGGKVWGPRFPGIAELARDHGLAEICARQWAQSVMRASRDLAALPGAGDRVFTIRYEELVAGEAALAGLVADLALPDAEAILAAHRARLRRVPPAQWRSLAARDRATLGRVLAGPLTQWGYEG